MKIIAPAFAILLAASLSAMAQPGTDEEARRQAVEAKRIAAEIEARAKAQAEKARAAARAQEQALDAFDADSAKKEVQRLRKQIEVGLWGRPRSSPFIKEPYRVPESAGHGWEILPPSAFVSRLERAKQKESEGKGPQAVVLYARAAGAGSGAAASRLASLYGTGMRGLPPDPNEAEAWAEIAYVMDVPASAKKPR